MSRLIFCFCLLLTLDLFAQNPSARVLVRNISVVEQGNYSIQLKWYSNRLFYTEGCLVYRRTIPSNEWVKISNVIKKKNTAVEKLAAERSPLAQKLFFEIKKDSALLPAIEIVNATTITNLKGIPLLLAMVKSFEHTAFAEYLGISFTDTSVQKGFSYQYKIVLPHQGSEDLLQKSAVIICGQYAPIPAPTIFAAKLQGKEVGLKWQNESERFFAVNVYRKSSMDTGFIKINKEPFMDVQSKEKNGKAFEKEFLFKDKNIKEGNTYQYKLTALDFFGVESIPTSIQTVIIPDQTPPTPLKNPKFRVETNQVFFSWQNTKGSDAKEYLLKRATKKDGIFSTVKRIPVGDTTASDLLEKTGLYFYKLVAIDQIWNESSSSVFPVESLDAIPPSIPEKITATIDSGKVSLNWLKNSEKDFLGYRIYRSYSCLPNTFLLLNAQPISQPTFSELLPDNRKGNVCYCLTAVDSSLNVSKLSNPVFLKIPDKIAPYKPFLKKVSQHNDSIWVEWIPNQEKDINGYEVYSKTNFGNNLKMNNPLILKGQNRLSFVPKYTKEPICVWIKALDSTGNISQSSDTLCLTFQPKADKEIGLELKIRKHKDKLIATWQHQKEVRIKGYVIYGKETNELKMKPLSGLTALQKMELVYNKTFTEYQIRAFGEDGTVYYSPILFVNP